MLNPRPGQIKARGSSHKTGVRQPRGLQLETKNVSQDWSTLEKRFFLPNVHQNNQIGQSRTTLGVVASSVSAETSKNHLPPDQARKSLRLQSAQLAATI